MLAESRRSKNLRIPPTRWCVWSRRFAWFKDGFRNALEAVTDTPDLPVSFRNGGSPYASNRNVRDSCGAGRGINTYLCYIYHRAMRPDGAAQVVVQPVATTSRKANQPVTTIRCATGDGHAMCAVGDALSKGRAKCVAGIVYRTYDHVIEPWPGNIRCSDGSPRAR
jgi:hypothetical protein